MIFNRESQAAIRGYRWCVICRNQPISHRIRSHDAVTRVYDESGNVVATHERKGEILERISKLGISRWDHPAGAVRLSSPISLQLFAAVRSSIRSRSTSQYLSDDRRSLS